MTATMTKMGADPTTTAVISNTGTLGTLITLLRVRVRVSFGLRRGYPKLKFQCCLCGSRHKYRAETRSTNAVLALRRFIDAQT